MSKVHEIHEFLQTLGLEKYADTLVHNGFYTSLYALSGATYEELVDCNVGPAHAKLILSSLRQEKAETPGRESGASQLADFLRSVGLEQCREILVDASPAMIHATRT